MALLWYFFQKKYIAKRIPNIKEDPTLLNDLPARWN